MIFVRGFANRPQRVWLRRANFHIHLWAGVLLALYLVVISVTGSILVFREDIETWAGGNPWGNISASGPQVDPAAILESLRAGFPGARVTSLSAPTKTTPVYLANVQSRGRTLGSSRIAIDPTTAELLGRTSRRLPANWAWLSTVRNLHVSLLSGVTGTDLTSHLRSSAGSSCRSARRHLCPGSSQDAK